jgi:hypothetical protein
LPVSLSLLEGGPANDDDLQAGLGFLHRFDDWPGLKRFVQSHPDKLAGPFSLMAGGDVDSSIEDVSKNGPASLMSGWSVGQLKDNVLVSESLKACLSSLAGRLRFDGAVAETQARWRGDNERRKRQRRSSVDRHQRKKNTVLKKTAAGKAESGGEL